MRTRATGRVRVRSRVSSSSRRGARDGGFSRRLVVGLRGGEIFSDSAAVEPAELLPYFERREDADATAFGVPSDRNICTACPSGDDGGSAPPSTRVETVVAKVSSRLERKHGPGTGRFPNRTRRRSAWRPRRTSRRTWRLARFGRAIRTVDDWTRRCACYGRRRARRARWNRRWRRIRPATSIATSSRALATREERHHAFAVSASATRAHRPRWSVGATSRRASSRIPELGRRRRRARMRRRRRGGRRRDISENSSRRWAVWTIRRAWTRSRGDTCRILARDLDAGVSALAGPGAAACVCGTRWRSWNPTAPRRRRACWRRGARRGCPVAATPLRTSTRVGARRRGRSGRRSRFYRGEPRLYDPASGAAMDPARVTSSDLRDGLNRGLVHGARVADGDVDAFAPWVDCLAVARALLGDHLAAIRLFLEIAADRPSRRRVREHCVAWGEDASNAAFRVLLWRAFPRISTRRGRWWRIRTCPWTWASSAFGATLGRGEGVRSALDRRGKTIAAGRTTRLHSETSRTVFRVSSLVVESVAVVRKSR